MSRGEEWSKRAFSLAGLISELAPPFAKTAPVRIPELRNVALTRRVLEVIDHPDFQRLRRVQQLGPAHLIYPGAVHTRFEHSIGVFENVRRYLLSLLLDPAFVDSAKEEDVLTGLAAGLLHDLGHYPFAHALESLHLKGLETPRHEDVGGAILFGLRAVRPIATLLEKEWGVDARRVLGIVTGQIQDPDSRMDRMLSSILHSPIDADKMDYLERDSIHMGVPYGRYYDRDRLLSTLAIQPSTHELAVTDKGRISAEIFIFCRYTMFSEAYWHHAVRSAEAMIERALEDFRSRTSQTNDELIRLLLEHSDESLLQHLHTSAGEGSAAGRISGALVSGRRGLYKRLLTLSLAHHDAAYRQACEKVLRLNRDETHRLEEILRDRISAWLDQPLHTADVIVDVPPPGKARLQDLDVIFEERNESEKLSSLSRTVETITEDFDRVVKKIRVFVEPAAAVAVRTRIGKAEARTRLLEVIHDLPEPDGQREMF